MEAGAWRPETFGHTGSAICYLHHLIIFVLHPNTHNTALITPHWLEIPVIRVAGIFRCFGPFAHGNVEAEEPNEDDSVELHISTYDRLTIYKRCIMQNTIALCLIINSYFISQNIHARNALYGQTLTHTQVSGTRRLLCYSFCCCWLVWSAPWRANSNLIWWMYSPVNKEWVHINNYWKIYITVSIFELNIIKLSYKNRYNMIFLLVFTTLPFDSIPANCHNTPDVTSSVSHGWPSTNNYILTIEHEDHK